MDIEQVREYCISKPYTKESFPFDEDVLVFKVGIDDSKSKIFALISLENPTYLLLKCEPLLAEELREKYSEIEAGYHMNKRHWNGVSLSGTLSDKHIIEMIDHSYGLIVGSFSKKIQDSMLSR